MMPFANAAALRQQLHNLAELSGQEIETARFIAELLREAGYEPQTGVGGHGVVASLKGAEPGPVVMLRADIDALPFPDETDPEKTVAIHACGHDAHAAMLLALAARLQDRRYELKGEVRFVFQPAEESLEGAHGMIADGVLDGVDIAVGAHIRPKQDLPLGTFCAAVRHSASATFAVTLEGRSAHAARPHLGVNPLEAAASLIQSLALRHWNPAQTWSVKATRMTCEQGAVNSLPTWVRVVFDVRAETNPLMDEVTEGFTRSLSAVETGFGVTGRFENLESCPAAEYDDELVRSLSDTIVETFGQEALAADCGGGGEDFHFYKSARPELRTVYFGIGTGATPSLHDRHMTFDESMLEKGVALFEAFPLKLLR